jgi:YD repeat-containing protein
MLLSVLVILVGACSEKPAPPAAPKPEPSKVLSDAGIGAIRFGMTLAQAEQAAGAKASLPEPLDPACSMVRFPNFPALRFMVENGTVTRADADPVVENAIGIAVGDTLEQVRSRHPGGTVSAHKYDANGRYVTFPSADGRAAIILELIDNKVSKIRAGLQPAVAYVETCG